jgi:hypothetical protein
MSDDDSFRDDQTWACGNIWCVLVHFSISVSSEQTIWRHWPLVTTIRIALTALINISLMVYSLKLSNKTWIKT